MLNSDNFLYFITNVNPQRHLSHPRSDKNLNGTVWIVHAPLKLVRSLFLPVYKVLKKHKCLVIRANSVYKLSFVYKKCLKFPTVVYWMFSQLSNIVSGFKHDSLGQGGGNALRERGGIALKGYLWNTPIPCKIV